LIKEAVIQNAALLMEDDERGMKTLNFSYIFG
jgi:hypothetical protein